MTKAPTAINRPNAREGKGRALPVNQRSKSNVNQVRGLSVPKGDVNQEGEGGRNLEPGVAGTGAGVVKTESRIHGGGSKTPARGQKRAVGGEVNADRPAPASETSDAPAASPEREVGNPMTGMQVGGHSWKKPAPDGDPGPGFYRFMRADLPDLTERQLSRLGTVIEVYGKDLAQAQATIGILVQGVTRSVTTPVIETRPVAYRATRLSKKHRKVIG